MHDHRDFWSFDTVVHVARYTAVALNNTGEADSLTAGLVALDGDGDTAVSETEIDAGLFALAFRYALALRLATGR